MRENGLVYALCDYHPRALCNLCKASHLLGSTLTGSLFTFYAKWYSGFRSKGTSEIKCLIVSLRD